MRKLGSAAAALIAGIFVVSVPRAEAQGWAPWPPPPGMTAGEYAARYGHRIDPYEPQARPRYRRDWDRERAYRRSERQRWRERSYYDDD
ncbi:MAG TPA: hypothetical protein VF744_14835 [Beijerinckiaceae bacterium]|jgi:hypothetical protein